MVWVRGFGSKLNYDSIQRGDVMMINFPLVCPGYISKRVVGLPGDNVQFYGAPADSPAFEVPAGDVVVVVVVVC